MINVTGTISISIIDPIINRHRTLRVYKNESHDRQEGYDDFKDHMTRCLREFKNSNPDLGRYLSGKLYFSEEIYED